MSPTLMAAKALTSATQVNKPTRKMRRRFGVVSFIMTEEDGLTRKGTNNFNARTEGLQVDQIETRAVLLLGYKMSSGDKYC